MMTKGDCKGQVFLSHPNTNNGLFFFLTTKYLNLLENMKTTYENPKYAEK